MIDVHNQLRQSELGLEELWLTKDPWFRIATSVYGMTITDAFLLAKNSAGSNAEVQKMSIKDFAYRVAYDMWNRKVADEPKNEILDGIPATDLSTVGGATSRNLGQQNTASSLSWYDLQESHEISLTAQKDSNGKPSRRACTIKSIGCQSVGVGKKCVSYECKNSACMSIVYPARNMHGESQGTFICSNHACRKEHWERIAKQVREALELEPDSDSE